MNTNTQNGSVLIFVILISLLLTVIGLAVAISSMSEFSMSTEYEAREKAFIIADGGFNETKTAIRGNDLLTLLQTTTVVPAYMNREDGKYGYRNPLPLVEARNLDFDNLPAATDTRTVEGLLTPAQGVSLGGGRYFAKISLEGMEDETEPLATVIANRQAADSGWIPNAVLRVFGIHESAPGTITTGGGRNSVAIIEGILRPDMSFEISSPLTLVGPRVDADFNGDSFDIVGDSTHTGITALNDDPGSNDARDAVMDIFHALSGQQKNNVDGAAGDFGQGGASLEDGTDKIRNSPNPDVPKILAASFLDRISKRIASAADVVYKDPTTSLSGTNVELGTVDNPHITYVDGNLSLSGSGSGVGLLVVRGTVEYYGAFDFDGLVLVLGAGDIELGGANKTISGGVLIAKILTDIDGNPYFGTSRISLSGNSDFIFDSDDINMAISLLPTKTLLWREIMAEIEPAMP